MSRVGSPSRSKPTLLPSLLFALAPLAFPSCATTDLQQNPCPQGERLDQAERCVPSSCALERWPPAPEDAQVLVYVDPSTKGATRGSKEHPYRSLRQAFLNTQTGEATHAYLLSAGTFAGNFQLNGGDYPIYLLGRCPQLTIIEGIQDQGPNLYLPGPNPGRFVLTNLSLRGGLDGVHIKKGDLLLEQVLLEQAVDLALWAEGAQTTVTLQSTVIQDTQPYQGQWGYGMQANSRAFVAIKDSLLQRNFGASILVSDPETLVVLERSAVVDTLPGVDQVGMGINVIDGAQASITDSRFARNAGMGIFASGPGSAIHLLGGSVEATESQRPAYIDIGAAAMDQASLTIEGAEFRDNMDAAILVSGATADLNSVTVFDTRPTPSLGTGWALRVMEGAQVNATNCDFHDNSAVGVFLNSPGSTLTLSNSRVRGTRSAGGPNDFGRGAVIQSGSALFASHTLFTDNQQVGVFAADGDTLLSLDHCVVEDTVSAKDGSKGYGVFLGYGARGIIQDSDIANNRDVGLLVTGAGTELDLVRTRVFGSKIGRDLNSGLGLVVQKSAQIEGTNLEIFDNAGVGAYVALGGKLRVDASSFEHNGFSGLALRAGSLEMTGGVVAGNGHRGGAFGAGLYTWNESLEDSDILLDGVTLRHHGLANVLLRGPGTYRFNDCAFEQVLGYTLPSSLLVYGNHIAALEGVEVWDGSRGLLVEGGTLSPSPGPGVLLHSSSATFANVTWLPGSTLLQQGCSIPIAEPQGDLPSGLQLCPVYDLPTPDVDYSFLLDEEALGGS